MTMVDSFVAILAVVLPNAPKIAEAYNIFRDGKQNNKNDGKEKDLHKEKAQKEE